MACELILGGARSGKSRAAEQRAAEGGMAVTVIATAEALDAEMSARIHRHQADRPAHWHTLEEPIELAAALKREAAALGANGVVLIGVGSSGSPVGMSVGAGSYGRHSGGGLSMGIPTTPWRRARDQIS